MIVVGLTGGIATGKSTVSEMFRHLGAHVIDYDVLAREVVRPGRKAWQGIVEEFGREILKDDAMGRYLRGGICTGIVAPYGGYLAGPLPEGEGMAVAEIDLRAIVRQKNVLDAAGHYARPDILRLWVDRAPHRVMEVGKAPAENLAKTGAPDEVDSGPRQDEGG